MFYLQIGTEHFTITAIATQMIFKIGFSLGMRIIGLWPPLFEGPLDFSDGSHRFLAFLSILNEATKAGSLENRSSISFNLALRTANSSLVPLE
jgi:hypothetical protein